MNGGYYGNLRAEYQPKIYQGIERTEESMQQFYGCILGALDAIHKLGKLYYGDAAKIVVVEGYGAEAADIRHAQRGWFHRWYGRPLYAYHIDIAVLDFSPGVRERSRNKSDDALLRVVLVIVGTVFVALGWSLTVQQAIKYYEYKTLSNRIAASTHTLRQFTLQSDDPTILEQWQNTYGQLNLLLMDVERICDRAQRAIAKNLFLAGGLVVGGALCIIGGASGVIGCAAVGLAIAAITAAVRGIIGILDLLDGSVDRPERDQRWLNEQLKAVNQGCNDLVFAISNNG